MGPIARWPAGHAREMLLRALETLLLAAIISTPAFAQDSVIDGIDMRAVCDEASGHMVYFRERLASPAPNETDFMLQVVVPVSGKPGVDYVWVTGIKPFDAEGQGIVEDDPAHAPLKK